MNKPTLVVLAAGIGSRYGGLKQLDTFTPQGDTILDFSIFDAIRAGFGKVVFVIRKSIEKDVRAFFEPKLKGRIEMDFVFQEVTHVPDRFRGIERIKPWGTGHAVLMAKDVVRENFAVINADDYYGKEAYEVMVKALKATSTQSNDYCMIGYVLKNTISAYGSVSRGVCEVDDQGNLTGMTERTHIERVHGKLSFQEMEGSTVPIDPNSVVSMNFFGFTPTYFDLSEALFEKFLEDRGEDQKAEFFIPLAVNHIITNGIGSMKVLPSEARWFGVTYKDDKAHVTSEIMKLKQNGIYPEFLWE
jgi:UTP-glucose-1-phosphate uridylyltransferase